MVFVEMREFSFFFCMYCFILNRVIWVKFIYWLFVWNEWKLLFIILYLVYLNDELRGFDLRIFISINLLIDRIEYLLV